MLSSSAVLEAIHVKASITAVPILRGVNLAVPEGSICGLIGRNGAGKTTFLRVAMGLLPSSGTLRFGGEELRKMPPYIRARSGIGYMPEDRRLVPALTAEENIVIPAWAGNQRRTHARLDWIYQIIPEIAEFRGRAATQLSGGQQKLVALARALVAGHRLLLLDEPTEGVAPRLAIRIAEILHSLKGSGISALVAGSDDTHLKHVFDQVCLLERGATVSLEAAASCDPARENDHLAGRIGVSPGG
jgi:branched-chain amino acid transport system ATP-binding protein